MISPQLQYRTWSYQLALTIFYFQSEWKAILVESSIVVVINAQTVKTDEGIVIFDVIHLIAEKFMQLRSSEEC